MRDGLLAGDVAVVTGASRGIGLAIVEALCESGAACALGGRDAQALAGVCSKLGRAGYQAMWGECDVRDHASLARFAELVLRRFAKVDIVIANAGVAGPTGPCHEIAPSEWQACIDTDLTGVYLTFRQFIPHLLERRSGSLIAVGSVTGKRPLLGRAPYAAAKMGVIGLVRTLALELGPYGIRVNCLCPGSVEGERIAAVIAHDARVRDVSVEEATRLHTGPSALGRLVRGDEVAKACVFLASRDSSAITGQDLNVSAGAVMY